VKYATRELFHDPGPEGPGSTCCQLRYPSGVVRYLILAVVLFTAGLTSAPGQATRQSDPEARAWAVLDSREFRAAAEHAERTHDRLVEEIIELTEIPAPPFKETARGHAFLEKLRGAGLSDVETDAEGNVLGVRKGTGGAPLVAIAAHLDTVFPEDTDVTVTRTGTRLAAPGIGDNSRGLAVLLAVIRALDAANARTASDILFIGNVGEEGPGDLRGMRYLFQEGKFRDRIRTFISIDGGGAGSSITTGGVGSKRYRAVFTGPGGHSYGAFGLVSPAFAMGKAMDKLSSVTVPASPKTTFNIGVVGGGTSVNSIPFETWMELDLRSQSPEALRKLDEQVHALTAAAVREENSARSTSQGPVTVEMKLIGDRPSGQTSQSSPLVQTAATVISGLGMSPSYHFSSTDSNIPMSLGIPAITLDSGGHGGRAHALDEWIDVEPRASLTGVRSILGILMAVAGLEPDGAR
jgi:acetylornithine deacetylase/succinyl-diaminopimelate desuccinylase-like protein